MAVKKKAGSTKRYGPRYGKRLKEKAGLIESQYNKRQKCPYCKKEGVKRVATGIWGCKKCGAKFTGKAYSIGQKA